MRLWLFKAWVTACILSAAFGFWDGDRSRIVCHGACALIGVAVLRLRDGEGD